MQVDNIMNIFNTNNESFNINFIGSKFKKKTFFSGIYKLLNNHKPPNICIYKYTRKYEKQQVVETKKYY